MQRHRRHQRVRALRGERVAGPVEHYEETEGGGEGETRQLVDLLGVSHRRQQRVVVPVQPGVTCHVSVVVATSAGVEVVVV